MMAAVVSAYPKVSGRNGRRITLWGGGESELFSIMEQVKRYRLKNQMIVNDDIRLTILRLANENGGLVSLAEKSNISYAALWNQLNRNAGVLAYTIPRIIWQTFINAECIR